ncbi:MAG TPA: CAP domain-containing protein [Candidatus Levybacteria bacterium]|nr:CAP domain-containing protein [Candidatus Levybacteria bacterium]
MTWILKNKITTICITSYLIWICTLILFFLYIMFIKPDQSGQYPEELTNILLIDVIIGVFVFILFCLFFIVNLLLHHRKLNLYLRKNKLLFQWGFVLFIIMIVFGTSSIYLAIQKNETENLTNGAQYSASSGISGTSQSIAENNLDYKIIEETNQERGKINIKPLTRSSLLDSAAKQKLDHMIANNYWNHVAPDGTDPWWFIKNTGYNYEYAGENLAMGFSTSTDTINAWMNSPLHRENVLNNKYTEIGVAYKYDMFQGSKQVVVVQMFGKPQISSNLPQNTQQTLNPNEPVHCNVHPNCGGGTKPLTRQECENSICCGVGDNKWEFYTDKSQCHTNTQNNNNSNSYNTPMFNSFGGYTMYCEPQNVSAAQSIISTMESKKTQWAKDYLDCSNRFYDNDSCSQSCKNVNSSELNTCYASYGYSGDQSSACTKTAWDNYSNCIKSCPLPSTSCDWVYTEQKLLSSQLSSLCK